MLYKPWRRRIDQKRVRNAYFEPLPQSPSTPEPVNEEQEDMFVANKNSSKDVDVDVNVNVEHIEATDTAGPAHQ